MRFNSRRLTLLILFSTLACHSSTTPAPAEITGSWSGTLTSNITDTRQAYTMTLNQMGSSVSGTWTSEMSGTLAGTVSGNGFSGTLTFMDAASCVAQITGTISGDNMVWTSELGFSPCGGAGGFTIFISRAS